MYYFGVHLGIILTSSYALYCCLVNIISEPPSKVRNLVVTDSSSTAISISWQRPLITGNGLHYEVLISDSLSITATRTSVESFLEDDGEVVDYTVSDLRPFTNYVITVVTHNAVSDLDLENEDRRKVPVIARTTEGGKSVRYSGLRNIPWAYMEVYGLYVMGVSCKFLLVCTSHKLLK